MKITEIPIITGCRSVLVEKEGNTIIISLQNNENILHCEQTGENEYIPDIGDLAIFWDKSKEWKAIVARLSDKEYAAQYQSHPYKASNEEWYDMAIRFRDPNQLDKIIKYKQNARKKETPEK